MQVNDKLHTTSASSPGKESLVPSEYGAKWATKKTVWALWRRDTSLHPIKKRTMTLRLASHNLVTVQTVLSQLLEKVCGGYYKP